MANNQTKYETESKGRLVLIDPNKVNDSYTGLVQPEDLFIYADLEIEKKPRTIIERSNNGTNVFNTANIGKISFLGGSNEKGRTNEKVLTTNYTRLTTVLLDKDKQPDSESFGIKNISIEFNSAYAPLIKIELIDIHGSTLFERGNESKYNVFFDLPYPLFKLTVKGFYGPAVTYCLHLLKFSARFNSQTGNFEITCNFIGYTFAFLSDMLLGYLRATPETTKGRQLFNTRKALDPELITLNDLIILLGEARNKLQKIAATNGEVKSLDLSKNILDKYTNYKSLLNEFINALAEGNSPVTQTTPYFYVYNSGKSKDNILKGYFEKLDSFAKNANETIENNSLKIPENSQNIIIFIDKFIKENYAQNGIPDISSIEEKYEVIKNNLNEKSEYLLLDFDPIYTIINKNEELIKNSINKLSNSVSETIDGTLTGIFGFKPTIRKFIKIFTVHVEVFMQLIQETSIKAMGDTSRTSELKRLSSNNLNNISLSAQDAGIYYPWPEYNENGIEQWIGKTVGLIPETILVEEFLQGLLKVQMSDDAYLSSLNEDGLGANAHYPSNIFDLPIYRRQSAYNELLSGEFNGSLDRIFLGVTTRLFNFSHCNIANITKFKPQKDTFELLGKYEAQNFINSLIQLDSDKKIINSLLNYQNGDVTKQLESVKNLMLNGSIDLKLKIGSSDVIRDDGTQNTYSYVYLRDNSVKPVDDFEEHRVYLPNFTDFSKFNMFYNDSGQMLDSENLKSLFSQYNTAYPQYSASWNKEFSNSSNPILYYQEMVDDGSIFAQIATLDEFNFSFNFPSTNELFSEQNKVSASASAGNAEVKDSNDYPPVKFSNISKQEIGTSNSNYLNTKCFIFDTDFGVNEMRYVLFDKSDGFFGTGMTVSSSIFFYKDISFDNLGEDTFWYASTPIPFAKKSTTNQYGINEPEYYISNIFNYNNNNLGAFSPLCYSLSGVAKYNIGLIGNGLSSVSQSSIDENNNDTPQYGVVVTDVYNSNNYGYIGQSINFPIWSSTKDTIYNLFLGGAKSFSNLPFYEGNEEVRQMLIETYNFREDQNFEFTTDDTKVLIGSNRLRINTAQSKVEGKKKIFRAKQTFNDWSLTFPTFLTFGANRIQLFGSELYFEQQQNQDYQDAVRVRAYLFLRMLPLLGNFKTEASSNNSERIINSINSGNIFSNDTIIKDYMLSQPGLQEVPYSWILALGATIWLIEVTTTAKLYLKDPNGETIVAGLDELPSKSSGILAGGSAVVPLDTVGASSYSDNFDYDSVGHLPKQFKDLCVDEFMNWTNLNKTSSMSWNSIRRKFEIEDFDNLGDLNFARTAWRNKWKNFQYTADYVTSNYNYASIDDFPYLVFQPYIGNNTDFEAIKLNTGVQSNLYSNGDIPSIWRTGGGNTVNSSPKYRYDYVCIVNSKLDSINETIWQFLSLRRVLAKKIGLSFNMNNITKTPKIFKTEFDNFYRGFFTELNERLKDPELQVAPNDELKKKVFGTIDNDLIRLNIYRQLSAIYIKWIGGSQNNIFTSCISDNGVNNKPIPLIERFKFIDRAYRDIGDELVINPFQIAEYMIGQLNQSFYDLVGSKILANNNLDFIALPTFINFRDANEVKNMFKTYTYKDMGGFDNISGPAFVCVYVGQTSQFLDLGNKHDFVNDGLDFNDENIPTDFSEPVAMDSLGNAIPVFLVNFADQNQSIFKDIKLDQVEFSETDESLQIINSLSSSRQEFIGQNLFNIYSVRSYSAEVDMLGNLTIQPFMYFQLNNIPMFHGGYMIIKVSHEIDAHMILTRFKGVRIKRVKTPLITEDLIYLNILNEFGDGNIEKIGLSEIDLSIDDDSTSAPYDNNFDWDDTWFADGIMDNATLTALNPTPPLVKFTTVTSPMGWRSSGVHEGVDISCPINNEVLSIADGEVTQVGIYGDGGLGIQVTHKNVNGKTIVSRYYHLNSIATNILDVTTKSRYQLENKINFKDGETIKVTRGQLIGYSGGDPNNEAAKNSGFVRHSTGGHLHFEIRTLGTSGIYETNDANRLRYEDATSSQKNSAGPFLHNPMQILPQLKYKTTVNNGNSVNDVVKNRKIQIKNLLKKYGMTKHQAAAVMGNMATETGNSFDPEIESSKDKNGITYYGLIQWSMQYNTKVNLGNTIASQIDYLFKMENVLNFMISTKDSTDIIGIAYNFAKNVEKCKDCTGTLELFKEKNPTRWKNAETILAELNNINGGLTW